MHVGSLMRLMIRFFKKFLPVLRTCLTLHLVFIVWRALNNSDVQVTSLATPSANVPSRTNSTKQNDTSTLLLSNYAAHESIVEHHIHRTKLLSTAVSLPNSVFRILLILVSTNVGNADRRQLIRKAWGADFSINTTWKTVFLLGKNSNDKEMEDVSKESVMYGAIL